MSKKYIRFVFTAALLFTSAGIMADFKSDIVGCLSIKNTADRLECFDAVAKYYQYRANTVSPATAGKEKTDISVVMKTVNETNVKTETKNETATVNEQQKNSLTGNFGIASASQEGALESIESRIIGKFEGWTKGLRLKLENGQKWEIISGKTFTKSLQDPKITISRAVFGSFSAKIEGITGIAKVKRVK